jgi:predicted LPLAT superfamily acyltransferase
MMKAVLLSFFLKISLFWGAWPLRFFSWWIATGYFFFRPSRRRASIQLYQVIFPERSRWYYLFSAWRQFHLFAATYADRAEIEALKGKAALVEGEERVIEAGKKGTGGIILTSHLGSYEIAARAFQRQGFKHLIIMGEKEAKNVPRDQREALKARGVEIQVATGQEGSLLEGLEMIKFIREGGFVSLAGDLVWTDPRSRLPVKIFGREAGLPAGPHLLAHVSGAPLFTLFCFRVKRGEYRITISPGRLIKASSRSERNKAIQASAQFYAADLEEAVRQHPFQWYIFEPFFRSSPLEGGKNDSDSLSGNLNKSPKRV